MASAELKELVELAKEAGLEGTELSNFLRDERTRLREREKEKREREEKEREREEKEREREEKERERQREREKEEGELRREREKAEAEALQRDADRHHEIELARLRLEDSVLNHSGQAERNNGSMGSIPKLPSFDACTYAHTYMSTQREVLEGQTRSHRAKRANFGRGARGYTPGKFQKPTLQMVQSIRKSLYAVG